MKIVGFLKCVLPFIISLMTVIRLISLLSILNTSSIICDVITATSFFFVGVLAVVSEKVS